MRDHVKTKWCNSPKHRLRNRVDKAPVLLKGFIAWPRPTLGTNMNFQTTVDNEGAAEHQENERVYDCREE